MKQYSEPSTIIYILNFPEITTEQTCSIFRLIGKGTSFWVNNFYWLTNKNGKII